MSVDLGCLKAGVAEKFLHHPQVGPTVEQMSGKAVPEGMRVSWCGGPAVEQAPYVSCAEGATPAVEKDGIGRLGGLIGGRGQRRPAPRQPGDKGGRGRLADWDSALT